MSVAATGRTAETEFYRSLAQIARDPEGFEKRIAALEEATAKAGETATKAQAVAAQAADSMATAEAMRRDADKITMQANDYAAACEKDIARQRAKLDADIAAFEQRKAVDLELLRAQKAEQDQRAAELTQSRTAVSQAEAENVSFNAALKKQAAGLETARQAADAREKAASDTLAKLRAAMSPG